MDFQAKQFMLEEEEAIQLDAFAQVRTVIELIIRTKVPKVERYNSYNITLLQIRFVLVNPFQLLSDILKRQLNISKNVSHSYIA